MGNVILQELVELSADIDAGLNEWHELSPEERRRLIEDLNSRLKDAIHDGAVEWEFEVQEADDPTEWDSRRQSAPTATEAERQLLDRISDGEFNDPVVGVVSGPFIDGSNAGHHQQASGDD